MRVRLFIVLCLLAALAPAAAQASMTMQIGAAEDEGRNGDPAVALAKMDLAKAAGFNAIRVSAIWAPGQSAVPADQLQALRAASAAAAFDGITIWASVMPYGSKTTPLTPLARKQFASFAADLAKRVPLIPYLIIGNEPNLNRYWMPQFTPSGGDAAAPAYEALLAQTYDAIKAANKKELVYGGAISPHGSDDPSQSRQTHSPTAFITDMGAAYRASGRTKPIMDGLAFHPYGSPTVTHPNSTTITLADYGKLVGLLTKAFAGTAQQGATLPIAYDEYGVESLIPAAEQSLYHGREPKTTNPVPEQTQANTYDVALTAAACQSNVTAMFLFHVTDESDLDRWQSGVYYPDGTPKSTRAVVKQTIEQIHAGAVDCNAHAAANDGWRPVTNTPASSTPAKDKDKDKGKGKGKGKGGKSSVLPVDGNAFWRLLGDF